VLVLDDAAVVRRVLSERLGRAHVSATCVCRNEEALGVLLRAAKNAPPVDALVQDHERPVGGDGTRMLKVMRRMYADRCMSGTGVRLRAVPVLVLSGEPGSCGPVLRAVDATVRVMPKHSSDRVLWAALGEMWAELRDRLVASAAEAGARVCRSPHGWVVDTGDTIDTPYFYGEAVLLEATLGRLERCVSGLQEVIADRPVAAR